jgi:hypothetical protein
MNKLTPDWYDLSVAIARISVDFGGLTPDDCNRCGVLL